MSSEYGNGRVRAYYYGRVATLTRLLFNELKLCLGYA